MLAAQQVGLVVDSAEAFNMFIPEGSIHAFPFDVSYKSVSAQPLSQHVSKIRPSASRRVCV